MKRLPPSIQEETRYLRFKIHAEETVEFSEAVDQLWQTLMNESGTVELSKADAWIIKNRYDEEKSTGVLRVNRDMVDQVRSALLFLTEIEDEKVFVEVEKVSGMIDKL